VATAVNDDNRLSSDMRSGRCPKCQSTDIRTGPTGSTKDALPNVIRVSFWTSITPQLRVCISCGYVEHDVARPADRATLAAKWPPGPIDAGGTRQRREPPVLVALDHVATRAENGPNRRRAAGLDGTCHELTLM